ncbi:MAG: 3-hydroxyacyl-[acyl-carrier-protein] dehydratase FabZ [Deltaproteobacteria bacterium]|nr:MAG: 3-hydroxyacyl-[acyl-carrier-protein] dehydratase FabZ [Deltaproteobacteria bacterium]
MVMNKEDIKKLIPHREPFLFVDEVVHIEPGVSIVAVKSFEPSEFFFKGHFPGHPVVPGVIIVEALAQVGGILVCFSFGNEFKEGLPALAGLENVRFRKPVLPGDRVTLQAHILRGRSRMWKIRGDAFVEGVKVAEADILASLFHSG